MTDYINHPIYQELPSEAEYSGTNSDGRIYIDLRAAYVCTNETEKPTRRDSKMTVTIETKTALLKKNEAKSLRIHEWRVSLYATRRQPKT